MIKPVKFLKIEIDQRTYNRIIRFVTKSVGGTSDLYFMCDKSIADKFKQRLNEPNEFIRLKHADYYIDLTIDKFKITNFHITISFGKALDFNRTRFIPKSK